MFQEEEEGAIIGVSCRDIKVSNYPDNYFKDVPYNTDLLIKYIEDNSLWSNRFIENIISDVKNKFIEEYHFVSNEKGEGYVFDEKLMLVEGGSVPTINELRKKKTHFDIVYKNGMTYCLNPQGRKYVRLIMKQKH